MLATGRAILTLVALGSMLPTVSLADQDLAACQAPAWNMSREIDLFGGKPTEAQAGNTMESAPILKIEHLYALKLVPQASVQFTQRPAKDRPSESSKAGLARFSVIAPGTYRITLDAPVWIDIVSPTGLIDSTTFHGWHGCGRFHKSVQYALTPNLALGLQLSGAQMAVVKLVITAL